MNNYDGKHQSIEMFSLKEKIEFFSSFNSLYKSDIPVADCLRSIMNSASSKNVGKLCALVSKNIEKGDSLRKAILPYSFTLGKAYTMLLVAGEEAGKLEVTLDTIEKNISREEDFLRNVISSLIYPAIIIFLAIGVFFFAKFFIIKVFTSMKDGIFMMQQEIKQLLVSACIKTAFIYMITAGCIFYILKNKKLQRKTADVFAKIIFISNILKDYYYKNFFAVFSLAYNAGIPLCEALSLSSSVMGISSIQKKLKKSEKMLSAGNKLTQALAAAGIFDRHILSQISAGEEAGSLDKTFKNIALRYEKNLELKINAAIKIIDPLAVLAAGILAGYIVITAYKSYYEGLMSIIS